MHGQNDVQSENIDTNIFVFFWKKVVDIAIKELGPVSNESLGSSTYYRGILKFLNSYIFEK